MSVDLALEAAAAYRPQPVPVPERAPVPCRIAMLAIDGSLASSLTAPLDAFRVANTLNRRIHPGQAEPFQLDLVHARGAREITLQDGLTIGGLKTFNPDTQILIIPGLAYHHPGDLLERLASLTVERELLVKLKARGVIIAGSCSGTFLMASSGILDGVKATTSWWLAPTFARQFPLVELDPAALHIESGSVITAGAVTAMFTVVLRIIEQRMGPELAQNTARILLVDYERQSQAPYITEALLQRPRSAFSERVEAYLRSHLAHAFSIDALAAHCRMSTRTLLRHFQQVYHRTPQAYLQELRIGRAKALLETTNLSLPEIVEQCGYSDVASFRKLFKRLADLTPADYRERFRLRGP